MSASRHKIPTNGEKITHFGSFFSGARPREIVLFAPKKKFTEIFKTTETDCKKMQIVGETQEAILLKYSRVKFDSTMKFNQLNQSHDHFSFSYRSIPA